MREIFKKSYSQLNLKQKEAVDTLEGPLMVVAGPGTGKTQVLTLRVANILRKVDVLASNILCLTFTESAAFNMRERLQGLIGREAYRTAIHTFHSFGVEVINRHPEFFYQGAIFSPADELTQMEVLEEILTELPHDNSLSAKHPEQGYVYLRDVKDAISQLKKAGITGSEFAEILNHNEESLDFIKDEINEVFGVRLGAKQFDIVEKLILNIRKYKGNPFPVVHMSPFLPAVASSLELALDSAKRLGKTSPISEWKTRETLKASDGRRVLKDEMRFERMRALQGIYKEYRERMHNRGYYDYEDMLLDVIKAIENNDVLRAELQEQYQYILVDEFQDTNDAQMRILRLLGESDVNEGRPNIMAVGDDDQAIFKFQGALASNVINFVNAYKDVKIVTLTHNYRSTENILNIAEGVIKKGVERLTNIIPGIKKELIAVYKKLGDGTIVSKNFDTKAHEYYFVAKEIKRLLDRGDKPGDIAVIARQHRDLGSAAIFLNKLGVPINYERQRDVLKEPHIRQLIQMSRFVCLLLKKKFDAVDYFLPEILSYPFWGLPRSAVWDISLEATSSPYRKSWIDSMLRTSDKRIKNIAEFFIDVSQRASWEPVEYVLDRLITGKFKEYYFGKDRLENDKLQYLSFLSSLRVFVNSLREYKQGKPLKLEDLVVFVDTHEKNRMPLSDTSPYINAKDAVHLSSAHKAKGMEFDTVFILSCQDDVWAGRGQARKLQFPVNLPISPAGDTLDDQLRLFYVALTRAKRHLYLTSYDTADSGRESHRLQFIVDLLEVEKESMAKGGDVSCAADVLTGAWEGFYEPPFAADEQAMLAQIVKDYKMSVTHLNNFLDVTRGGPQMFLEQNLLRFPQPKSVSGVYGSAMHKTLQMLYLDLKKNGSVPSLKQVLSWFEQILARDRLGGPDFKRYLKRGKDSLTAFWAQKRETFSPQHEIEVDFKEQGVVVGEAHLSGKIDKIVKVSSDEISVHDWKTGKIISGWNASEVKAINYKRQLVFYKLLVENSRELGAKYKVRTGVLEFLEPFDSAQGKPRNGRIIDLPLEIREEDAERLRLLIEAVYKKIKNFDFPDISAYPKNTKGIVAFEEDLLEEKV